MRKLSSRGLQRLSQCHNSREKVCWTVACKPLAVTWWGASSWHILAGRHPRWHCRCPQGRKHWLEAVIGWTKTSHKSPQDGSPPSQRGLDINNQQLRVDRKNPPWGVVGKSAAGSLNILRMRENKRSPTALWLPLGWEDSHKKCHSDGWRGDKVWSDGPTSFQGWCVFLGASFLRAGLVNLRQSWSL